MLMLVKIFFKVVILSQKPEWRIFIFNELKYEMADLLFG